MLTTAEKRDFTTKFKSFIIVTLYCAWHMQCIFNLHVSDVIFGHSYSFLLTAWDFFSSHSIIPILIRKRTMWLENNPSFLLATSFVVFFAGDIGGLLGLCIGASLLSIVEIMDLVGQLIFQTHHRLKMRGKANGKKTFNKKMDKKKCIDKNDRSLVSNYSTPGDFKWPARDETNSSMLTAVWGRVKVLRHIDGFSNGIFTATELLWNVF